MAVKIDKDKLKGVLAVPPYIFTRCVGAGIYLEDGYVVLVALPYADRIAGCTTWKRYPYGTYTWKAKIENAGANKSLYVGFGELASGYWHEAIFVWNRDGTYYFTTLKNSVSTETALAGQDWTVERTFKVEWSADFARLSVEDVVVATHTTNVPDLPLTRFIELVHAPTAPANFSRIWAKDFGEWG